MRTVALVGVSGVGKSTLLRSLSERIQFRHLQASDLIKEEMKRLEWEPRSSESLRSGSVLANQQLLLTAFRRATAGIEGLAVLDGHTVIDSPEGMIKIPPSVFRAISPEHMIFVQGDPGQIVVQRLRDPNRMRPNRSSEELAAFQSAALIHSAEVCLSLGILLSVVPKDLAGQIADVLAKYA